MFPYPICCNVEAFWSVSFSKEKFKRVFLETAFPQSGDDCAPSPPGVYSHYPLEILTIGSQ